ncbi:MAG TPA: hypothetical protein VGI40_03445 [Pirellulaceae bacterium]
MNKAVRLRFWFRAALVGVALAVQHGCGWNQGMPEEKHITWDSPKMHEIERQWQSLQDAYDNNSETIPGKPGKDKYAQLEKMVNNLLRKNLSDRELRKLAGSTGTIPDLGFGHEVVEFMVRYFTRSGDRESLIALLSKRCPGRVGFYDTVEFCLTHRGQRLKDPILILGEAYSKCQVPAARHDLAAAVRRGFGGLGIRGQDDAEYIENAMQWYEKEKDHLVVNPNYWRNEMHFPLEMYEMNPKLYDEFPSQIKRELLFERKTPSQGLPKPNAESGQKTSRETSPP